MPTPKIPEKIRNFFYKSTGNFQSGRDFKTERNILELINPTRLLIIGFLVFAFALSAEQALAQSASLSFETQMETVICKIIDVMGWLQYLGGAAVVIGIVIVGGLASVNRFNFQKFGNAVLGAMAICMAPGILRYFTGEGFAACVGKSIPAPWLTGSLDIIQFSAIL